MEVLCKEPYVFIKGKNIKVSDIIFSINEYLQNNTHVYDNCRGISVSRIKIISVFASDTLFIDIDAPIPPNFPIVVIAPKWEVIGTRKIGSNAADEYSPIGTYITSWIRNTTKLKDGDRAASIGMYGKPGLPGVPGGTFFGIGEIFVNGSNLEIVADGSTGGRGQDGGVGYNGSYGKTPSPPYGYYCREDLCRWGNTMKGFDCQQISCNFRGGFFGRWAHDCLYRLFGKPGQKPGDGGHGGRGGNGGNPGSITLLELKGNSGIIRHAKKGKNGINGRGGFGGNGGSDGADIVAKCKRVDLFHLGHSWHYSYHTETKAKYVPGKRGTDGANDRFIEKPILTTLMTNSELADIINEYKSFLRISLSDPSIKSSLMEFFEMLDSNPDVKSFYSTLGLINELDELEKHFQSLTKDVNFLRFYQTLLNRIREYAENPKQGESSNQYKKVLNYLYAAILGRIYSLKDTSESDLIIDVRGYFNSLKKDIESLKDLQNSNSKVLMINKYKEEYKRNMDEKIKEANIVIEKTMIPEMEKVSVEIDSKIDLWINATLTVQEEAELKKLELKNALTSKGLLGSIKMISLLMNFFGSAGTAISSVIGYLTSMKGFMFLDSKTNQEGTIHLPQGLKSDLQRLENQIIADREEDVTGLKNLLESLYQDTTEYPELLNITSDKVNNIKNELNEINKTHDYKSYFNAVKGLEKQLKGELESSEADLKDREIIDVEKTENAKKIISKYKQALQIGLLGFDIYKKYENDQAKLDVLTSVIEETQNLFHNLRDFKEKIYIITSPTLQHMADNLHYMVSNLHTKSKVAIAVRRWHVQNALTVIKLQMQQLTKGFGKDHSLALSFEKLNDVMTTLFDIYNYIQSYQEQQTLANFIADVSSAATSRITITDPKLSNVVNKLEINMRSNLILKQYQIALKAFKQFVFPFAHIYLDEFTIPNNLVFEKNFENVVSIAVTQIEAIKSKLENYKQSVKKHDRYIGKGVFSSQYASTKPYFVWRNREHKEMLSKLLSGQEVVVNADVMDSAPDKDAIKFNVIALDFRTKNKTMQSKLYDMLKTFEIHATHFGNSFYRYGDQTYLMKTRSLDLDFNFERKPDGEPVHSNVVYEKMKNGDFMLSPYATWKIMMTNLTSNISFSDLGMYKDEIDMELTGYGHYVKKRGVNVLNLTVDKYYKAFYSYYDIVPNAKINILDMDISSEYSTVLKHRDIRSIDQVEEYSNDELNKLDVDYTDNIIVLKHRDIRLVDQIEEMRSYMTSSADPGLSSTINYAFKLIKDNCEGIRSKVMTFVQQVFIDKADASEKKIQYINDKYRETASEEKFQNKKHGLTRTSKTIEDVFHEEAEILEESTKGISNSKIFEADLQLGRKTLNSMRKISEKDLYTTSFKYFNEYNNNLKSSLPNEQQNNLYSVQQVPEINSSLLLVDSIVRLITGERYKSAADEALFSPSELIEIKILKGGVHNENHINQNFHRLLAEFGDDEDRSWVKTVKSCIKSTGQFFGFFGEEDMDSYIQDIKGLFAFENLHGSLNGM